jgi:mRNA deadenylase 3'-5' endonuclease subunit Ccr4
LGLKNKKEEVKNFILKYNIDMLCIQEAEVEHGYQVELLGFKDYSLELEMNSV